MRKPIILTTKPCEACGDNTTGNISLDPGTYVTLCWQCAENFGCDYRCDHSTENFIDWLTDQGLEIPLHLQNETSPKPTKPIYKTTDDGFQTCDDNWLPKNRWF